VFEQRRLQVACQRGTCAQAHDSRRYPLSRSVRLLQRTHKSWRIRASFGENPEAAAGTVAPQLHGSRRRRGAPMAGFYALAAFERIASRNRGAWQEAAALPSPTAARRSRAKRCSSRPRRRAQRSMTKEPGRFRGTFGTARAAKAAGDAEKARRHYQQTVEIAGSADSPRPEIRRAREYLGAGG
jgi:hypothetical protein